MRAMLVIVLVFLSFKCLPFAYLRNTMYADGALCLFVGMRNIVQNFYYIHCVLVAVALSSSISCFNSVISLIRWMMGIFLLYALTAENKMTGKYKLAWIRLMWFADVFVLCFFTSFFLLVSSVFFLLNMIWSPFRCLFLFFNLLITFLLRLMILRPAYEKCLKHLMYCIKIRLTLRTIGLSMKKGLMIDHTYRYTYSDSIETLLYYFDQWGILKWFQLYKYTQYSMANGVPFWFSKFFFFSWINTLLHYVNNEITRNRQTKQDFEPLANAI